MLVLLDTNEQWQQYSLDLQSAWVEELYQLVTTLCMGSLSEIGQDDPISWCKGSYMTATLDDCYSAMHGSLTEIGQYDPISLCRVNCKVAI